MIEIHCNICHEQLVSMSTCFYTICGHIYCESCICQIIPSSSFLYSSSTSTTNKEMRSDENYSHGRFELQQYESDNRVNHLNSSSFMPWFDEQNKNDSSRSHGKKIRRDEYNSRTIKCPICQSQLNSNDIKEILIGIISPISLFDQMLQHIFQNTNWSVILENLLHVNSCMTEISSFLYQQLLYEMTFQNESHEKLMKKMENTIDEKNKVNHQFKNEINTTQQKIRELEHHIQRREKELCDIKEAYAEKVKKCDAWEKAYNSLRGQGENSKSSSSSWKFSERTNSMRMMDTEIGPKESNGMANTTAMNMATPGPGSTTRMHRERSTYRLSIPTTMNSNPSSSSSSLSLRNSFKVPSNSPPMHPTDHTTPPKLSFRNENKAPFFNQFKAEKSSFFERDP